MSAIQKDRSPLLRFLGNFLLATTGIMATAFLGWEIHAIWQAEKRTPAILQQARAKVSASPLLELTALQREILLAVEDPGFKFHKGIDLRTPGQGLTTITQALVKLLYFERFQPGFAKIEQSMIARFVLDRNVEKDEQIRLFVALARFGTMSGREITGFGEASVAYFGKTFDQLDRQEFIGLVGMLIAPNSIRPDKPTEFHERIARINALLGGLCVPAGLMDTLYESCAGKK